MKVTILHKNTKSKMPWPMKIIFKLAVCFRVLFSKDFLLLRLKFSPEVINVDVDRFSVSDKEIGQVLKSLGEEYSEYDQFLGEVDKLVK